MKKMRISSKVRGGIWCPDLKGHYRLFDRVAQRKDQKGRVTVPYSFYTGTQWLSDVAFITQERLALLVAFANKNRLEVDSTYRALAEGGIGDANDAGQMVIGSVPATMDFRA